MILADEAKKHLNCELYGDQPTPLLREVEKGGRKMKLEDLLVSYQTYQVRKVNGKIVARKSKSKRGGLYKARNANDVRNILTNGKSVLPVYVRLSNRSINWTEIRP